MSKESSLKYLNCHRGTICGNVRSTSTALMFIKIVNDARRPRRLEWPSSVLSSAFNKYFWSASSPSHTSVESTDHRPARRNLHHCHQVDLFCTHLSSVYFAVPCRMMRLWFLSSLLCVVISTRARKLLKCAINHGMMIITAFSFLSSHTSFLL